MIRFKNLTHGNRSSLITMSNKIFSMLTLRSINFLENNLETLMKKCFKYYLIFVIFVELQWFTAILEHI